MVGNVLACLRSRCASLPDIGSQLLRHKTPQVIKSESLERLVGQVFPRQVAKELMDRDSEHDRHEPHASTLSVKPTVPRLSGSAGTEPQSLAEMWAGVKHKWVQVGYIWRRSSAPDTDGRFEGDGGFQANAQAHPLPLATTYAVQDANVEGQRTLHAIRRPRAVSSMRCVQFPPFCIKMNMFGSCGPLEPM